MRNAGSCCGSSRQRPWRSDEVNDALLVLRCALALRPQRHSRDDTVSFYLGASQSLRDPDRPADSSNSPAAEGGGYLVSLERNPGCGDDALETSLQLSLTSDAIVSMLKLNLANPGSALSVRIY